MPGTNAGKCEQLDRIAPLVGLPIRVGAVRRGDDRGVARAPLAPKLPRSPQQGKKAERHGGDRAPAFCNIYSHLLRLRRSKLIAQCAGKSRTVFLQNRVTA